MPTYRNPQIPRNDIRIKTEPLGLRHFLKFIPYLTGHTLNVKITASANNEPFTYYTQLFLVNGNGRQVSSSDEIITISTDSKYIQTKFTAFISMPGHYCLQFTIKRDGRDGVPLDIVEFNAPSKDLVLLDWGARFACLVFGGVLGWVVSNLGAWMSKGG